MMVRAFLVLVLTVLVGCGFVGTGLDGACTVDDCEAERGDDDPGAGAGQGESDDCPPFCSGCVRLPVHTVPRVAIQDVPVRVAPITTVSLVVTPSAPPRSGLFRPPRA